MMNENNNIPATIKSIKVQFTSFVNCIAIKGMHRIPKVLISAMIIRFLIVGIITLYFGDAP